MPGINDTLPTTLNPNLLSASNLVNPNAPPTITPSAVQAMTDSIRSGALTAQDVLDRTGELGKVHRKAQIELHKRQIADLQDPDLVAARHAVEIAGGQVARTQGATAASALPLVQPAADVQGTQIAKQAAELKHGAPGAVDAYASIYGDIPKLADGQPDYELAAVKGSQVRGGQMWYQFATERQKPDPALTQKIPRAGGGEDIIYRNAQGDIITPGSPKWKEYEDIKAKAFPLHNLTPGNAQTAAPAPVPEPSGADRARLVNEQGIPPAQASTMNAADVQAKLGPQPAAALPVVALPPRTPGPGEYNPATGGTVIQSQELPKAAEITEQFRKQKSYEAWNASLPFYGSMANTMDQINKIPIADQRAGKVNLNAQDIELISNFVKLYDPNAVIREFKFDKIEHSQPIPDQLRNWMSTITRSGQLTPEARQELFRTATEAYRSKQMAITPDLQMAAKRASDSSLPIEHVLNPEEQRIARGEYAGRYSPPGSLSIKPTGAGHVVTLSNGMRVQRASDGQYYPAQ